VSGAHFAMPQSAERTVTDFVNAFGRGEAKFL